MVRELMDNYDQDLRGGRAADPRALLLAVKCSIDLWINEEMQA